MLHVQIFVFHVGFDQDEGHRTMTASTKRKIGRVVGQRLSRRRQPIHLVCGSGQAAVDGEEGCANSHMRFDLGLVHVEDGLLPAFWCGEHLTQLRGLEPLSANTVRSLIGTTVAVIGAGGELIALGLCVRP
jgi:hypothetical protein